MRALPFALAHYAALAIFVAACWGFGRALLTRLGAPVRRDVWLEAAMAITLGVGLFICAFQFVAALGLFRLPVVLALVGLGIAAAGVQTPAMLNALRAVEPGPALPWTEKAALIGLALFVLPALVEPLSPPAAFDELMYHLPYARLVAQTGALGIHEWLRYPWFPYNYNLLYAAALLVGDDVLPHLLNGLAGVLSAWMVYRVGVLYANRVLACVAAAICLGLGDYSNALIDLGVALFVMAACVALWWWRESPPPQGGRWLALAAFFLGVAAGSKYQALVFLPLVAVFVLWHERRVRVLAPALACFLVPCVYWYARNAITTGDPFNPIGASVFGFSNWNANDYRQQLDDVRVHAALPNFLIWPVLLAPFGMAWRARSPAVRAAIVFCAYSVVVWLLTSRYPRYLAASFPMLALVAAFGWQALQRWAAAGFARLMPARAAGGNVGRWMAIALLVVLAGISVQQTARKAATISPTPEQREAFLRKHVPGYAVMHYLQEHATGRVYQIALSEAIYYGPNPIWGDALGPWRYADYLLLPPPEMARKLAKEGFEAIVMPDAMLPRLTTRPGFDDHFALMIQQDGARAYRIVSTAP